MGFKVEMEEKIMRNKICKLAYLPLFLLTSCAAMAPWAETIKDIATDEAIKVQVDKEALIKKDTNVHINVDIISRDVIPPIPPLPSFTTHRHHADA